MKILLAINLEELEKYIQTLDSVEVCDVVRKKKNLLEKIKKFSPDIIMLSHNLPGDEDIKNIIEKITSKDFFVDKIIYLYGED